MHKCNYLPINFIHKSCFWFKQNSKKNTAQEATDYHKFQQEKKLEE
jgi:hypothetical protein